MTIETTDGSGDPVLKSGPYNGDGSTASFDYDFQTQDEEELLVTRQNTDGTETVLTLTTDYTVSGVDSDTGGSITLTDPANDLPAGTKLVIQYNGLYSQTTDYSNQGRIKLEILEKSLDKVMMHLRSVKELADRAVKVDAFDATDLATLTNNINNLGAIYSELSAIAAIISDISTVAAVDTDVSAVAAVDTEVVSLAAVDSEIVALEAIKAAISAVAAIDTEVTNVANNIADVTNFANVYYGAAASDPATRPDGSATQTGDMYFSTADDLMQIYDGSDWVSLPASLLGLGTAATKDTGTDSGDVPLIGDDATFSRLDVTDAAPKVNLTDTSTGVVHSLNGNSGVGNFFFRVDENNEGTGSKFILNVGNSSSVITANADSEVGIGTASPSTALDVNGTVTATGWSGGTQSEATWETGTSTTESIVSPAKVKAAIDANGSDSPVKAWVNFDGTGTVSIRESFNVSSITDNGTGDYTVNFANDLAHVNYAVSGAAQNTAHPTIVGISNVVAPTVSDLSIQTENHTSSNVDATRICVTIVL